MDGLPLDVEGGHSRRSAHGDLFARVPGQMLQQRRLSRARAARDEDVLARVFDEPEQRLLLGGEGRRAHRIMLVRPRRPWRPVGMTGSYGIPVGELAPS